MKFQLHHHLLMKIKMHQYIRFLFASKDEKNSYVCFDFKDKFIIPKSYKLRTYNNGSYHLKNWVVEASNGNSSWETLDKQENCSYLNDNEKSHSFGIENPNHKKFRCIRIRLTDVNWCNNYALRINSFEIYGSFEIKKYFLIF